VSDRSGTGLLRRLRLVQIRFASAAMRTLTRRPSGASLVRGVRRLPLVRPVIDLVAGYNRVYPTLDRAERAAAWYSLPSHESSQAVCGLLDDRARLALSDYPVLYHLSRLPLAGLRVFDLGGSAGEVFYLYDRALSFPGDLSWVVHDLPANMEFGRNFARERGEARLRFADGPHEADGADVLHISGALHYLPFALADCLSGLARRPPHIFINRTPLVDQPTAATVQLVRGVMVACRLLNQAELVAGVEKLGYRLVDSWRVPELSIRLPYDPEYWVREYRGLYFRAENGGRRDP
jgi:putative methyltransferase (TIGR04325 family)